MDGPIKWHGGKFYLAKKLVALMPKHTHYVEPYAGGLSVLFEREPEDTGEVVNDINRELTNFWLVLQRDDSFSEFRRRVEAIPPSEDEYLRADEWRRFNEPVGVDSAVAFFICCRQSRAATFKGFATLAKTRTRRGMNELPSAWWSSVAGLAEIHARLSRVVILNRPAMDVIRTQDGPATLFYLDPPYLHETRATPNVYAHEMSYPDHAALLLALHGIKGKFMLSGYRSSMYDGTAAAHGWNRHDFELPNHAAGGESKRRMVECVWCNF